MNRYNAYREKIKQEEVDALRGYDHFLSIFYNNIGVYPAMLQYGIMEKEWLNKLENITRVMKGMDIPPQTGERDSLLENCRVKLKNIQDSLDRIKGSLHDDICSLNKKNNRMGLRYNRYELRTADPGLIDITT